MNMRIEELEAENAALKKRLEWFETNIVNNCGFCKHKNKPVDWCMGCSAVSKWEPNWEPNEKFEGIK